MPTMASRDPFVEWTDEQDALLRVKAQQVMIYNVFLTPPTNI